jgi:hypothetical protein
MPRKATSTSSNNSSMYRLTAMDKDVFKTFEQSPKKSAKGGEHHIRMASLMQELRAVNESTLIERMGAMLLLCSFVEGRIRAAYRDRYAMMLGADFRSQASEAHEFDQAAQSNKIVKNGVVDTSPLQPQLIVLRRYNDIDQALYSELERFVKVRNAIAHDAMYRPDAFTHPLIEAVDNLVVVTRNMRERIKRKTRKERVRFEADNYHASYFQGLAYGEEFDDAKLSNALNLTTSLVAPLIHGRPLYVVAQSSQLQLKVEDNERLMHTLWDGLIASQTRVPVFQKIPNSQKMCYRGYGYLARVDREVSDAIYIDVEVGG